MNHIVFCVQNMTVPQDTRVWREALALRRAGRRVTVICPRARGSSDRTTRARGSSDQTTRARGSSDSRRQKLDGIDIIGFPAAPEISGLFGQILETATTLVCTAVILANLRLRGRIDVLHAANPPDSYFLVAALLRPFGTRFVFDQHDLVPELLAARKTSVSSGNKPSLQARLFRFLEARSYRNADVVISPNNSYRAVAMERGAKPAHQVFTVRSGPDAVYESAQATPEPAVPVIAFAGVIGRQDGVETLVDAVAELHNFYPGAFVVQMIGRGDDVERLQEKTRKLGVESLFTWSGWVDQQTLAELLRKATIAVSPDEDNPFTRRSTMTKIAEYLSFGLPAVVAELPENRFTAGDAALYYEAGNAADLAKRLEEVLADNDLRRQLRNRALRRASGLTWEHSAQRLVQIYSHLLDDLDAPEGDQNIMSHVR